MTRTTCAQRARSYARAFDGARRLLRGQGFPLHGGCPLDRRGRARPGRVHRRRTGRGDGRRASRRNGSRCTATTSRPPSSHEQSQQGWGRSSSTRSTRSSRLAELAAAAGVRQRVLVRVTVGVEAHTHEFIATAHEDQKFGFSLSRGPAERAVAAVLRRGLAGTRRAAFPYRLADLRHGRLRRRRASSRRVGCGGSRSARHRDRRDQPRRRPGHRLCDRRRSRDAEGDRRAAHRDRRARVHCGRPADSAAGGRARTRDRRAVRDHRVRGRHRQGRRARREPVPQLCLGRRWDERQHPHCALRRELHVCAREPRVPRRTEAVAGCRPAL